MKYLKLLAIAICFVTTSAAYSQEAQQTGPTTIPYKIEISKSKYVAGGVLETVLGAGIGHFVQGRNLSGGLTLGGTVLFMALSIATENNLFLLPVAIIRLIALVTAWAPGEDYIIVETYSLHSAHTHRTKIVRNNFNRGMATDLGIKISVPF